MAIMRPATATVTRLASRSSLVEVSHFSRAAGMVWDAGNWLGYAACPSFSISTSFCLRRSNKLRSNSDSNTLIPSRRFLFVQLDSGLSQYTGCCVCACGRVAAYEHVTAQEQKTVMRSESGRILVLSHGSRATVSVHGPSVQTLMGRFVLSCRKRSSTVRRIDPVNGVYRWN